MLNKKFCLILFSSLSCLNFIINGVNIEYQSNILNQSNYKYLDYFFLKYKFPQFDRNIFPRNKEYVNSYLDSLKKNIDKKDDEKLLFVEKYYKNKNLVNFGFSSQFDINIDKNKNNYDKEELWINFNHCYKNFYANATFTMKYNQSDPYLKKRLDIGIECSEGYLGYKITDNLFVNIGRFKLAWGVDYSKQTLLSRDAFAYNGYRIFYKYKNFSFETFFSQLDTLGIHIEPKKNLNRFLNGHRISVNFENFQAGFSEIIIYGGENRQFDIGYANPFFEYFLLQGNEKEKYGYDDNPFILFDMNWKFLKNYLLYLELMIDDIQIDNKIPSDKEPTEFGVILGLKKLFEKSDIIFNLEYMRINPWTYNQYNKWNRLIYRGKCIGFEKNNVEKYYISLDKNFKKNIFNFNFEFERGGSGNIYDEWTEPWLNDPSYQEKFPYGSIYKNYSIFCGYTIFFNYNLGVNLKLFNKWGNIKNKGLSLSLYYNFI